MFRIPEPNSSARWISLKKTQSLGSWDRGEGGRIENSEAMWLVTVFRAHLAELDDQLGRKGIPVFAVDQDVGSNFAENGIADADAISSFQIKWVGQVLMHEGYDTLVALDKIGGNQSWSS